MVEYYRIDSVMNTMDAKTDNFKTQHYSVYINRVNSFETWPKQMKQDKFSLARAGFHYTLESDIVECFACGIRIRDWEVNDIPAIEHEKHSPSCKYMKLTGTGERLDLDTCG